MKLDDTMVKSYTHEKHVIYGGSRADSGTMDINHYANIKV